MDLNPIHHLSPGKKIKCSYFDYVQLLMLARLVNGLEPHLPLLFSQKKWNARFWITFTSDDLPGWLMNLNLICHPSPPIKMKCSIFDYVQLLMISQAGQLTQSPSATPLQPIKWNASFWIMFNFWWSARLVDGLEPHLPPFSSQKNEMLTFGLCSIWMISQAGRWTQTPSITSLQPIKWNTHFWITFNFWWSAGLVGGLKPHSPPFFSQKNEMLLFGLRSTSDDQLGWSMDSNPILHVSPAKEMKCSYLYYVQLLMIGQAGRWTRTPSSTSLQPKKWNAYFCIMFNF